MTKNNAAAFIEDAPWKILDKVIFCDHDVLRFRPRLKVYECERCHRRVPAILIDVAWTSGYDLYLASLAKKA